MTIPSPPTYSEVFGHPFSTNVLNPVNLPSTSQPQAIFVSYRNGTENVQFINLPINVPQPSTSFNYANVPSQINQGVTNMSFQSRNIKILVFYCSEEYM